MQCCSDVQSPLERRAAKALPDLKAYASQPATGQGGGEGLGHIEGHLGPSYVGAMLGSYSAMLGHVECMLSDVAAMLGPSWSHLGPKMGYRRVSCTYNGPFWGHVQRHKTFCKIRAFLLKPASMPRWPILNLVEASLCYVGLGSGLVVASRTMLGACSGLVAGHNGQNPCKTAFFVTAQLEDVGSQESSW